MGRSDCLANTMWNTVGAGEKVGSNYVVPKGMQKLLEMAAHW